MISHVVHGLNSMNRTASYIKVTTRVLPSRVHEHHDALRDVRYSAVTEHAVQTGHNID